MIEPSPIIIILSIVLTLITITEKLVRNNKRLKPLLYKLTKNKQIIEASIKSGKTEMENNVLQDIHNIYTGIDEMVDISNDGIVFKIPFH